MAVAMRFATPFRLLAGLAIVCLLLVPSGAGAALAPKVEGRADRNPDPGGNFTLTFTLTSYQTANYTILVSPRPEFSFADLSNGSRRQMVANGTAADFNFDLTVARSASKGAYVISYSVLREDATVKMGTVEFNVGTPNDCTSFVVLLPVSGLAIALAYRGRPRR
jgi:methionine-rich copper-binding protein CopC